MPGDLTALNWNSQGTLLAVGSYDCILRILTSEGDSYFTSYQHQVKVMVYMVSMIFRLIYKHVGAHLLCAVFSRWAAVIVCKFRRDYLPVGCEGKTFIETVSIPPGYDQLHSIGRVPSRCSTDCCLDAEWMDATTFATAGADGNIYVMKTESPEPIKKFRFVDWPFLIV